ncbi:DUF2911 domain-containing protein [Cellulophaga baltica]|uniref:DUF2911 domain-containing protein n=1 Tax=Cellulophaga TaxID=104264 RepID=UPI001C0709DC|nr:MULTISPECIES: DUF2911 domain-containing protein [Cellulophaga]MBU2997313.1 DUF2911 domain-containing protein [Cellulophaga baltica]MDO6768711.1 DUF2911 domain-containing protein [Cellulophaga sp. 1_MG-2023]
MKKAVILFVTFCTTLAVNAQIETPQPSPVAKTTQVVGLTDVTLEYSRPAKRGRTIFGDLITYGKLWRTGANKNSIVTFSDDVTVGTKELKAGSYAIFTTPGESVWEINFYTDTENWGTPKSWDASKVAAVVKVNPTKITESVESLTLAVNDLNDNGANLDIIWANTKVSIPFTVPTEKTVMKAIDNVMAGPSSNDYYAAAVYYLNSDKDINKAKEWIDKAIELAEKPAYYQYRRQSLIYAKAGDKKGAIKAAKISLEGAKEANNNDYIRMNTASLKEWGAM